MPVLIAIAVFFLVALLVFMLGWALDQRSAKARLLRDRLETVEKTAERKPGEGLALVRDEMLSRFPALDNLLRRSERISDLQTLLSQADMGIRAVNVLGLCAVSALALGFAAFLVSRPLSGNESLLFTVVGVMLGAIMPYSFASYRRSKRFQKFEELFPEAIDTLARAVRAGHALTSALELIANEVGEPVSSEFRKLFEEQKFGLPVRDALRNFTKRVTLVDVKFFVTAGMVPRRTGRHLAGSRVQLFHNVRARLQLMRQVRVHTAQGHLTMILLMGLPPIIVVSMQA